MARSRAKSAIKKSIREHSKRGLSIKPRPPKKKGAR
jgi:hypothetical protein